MASRRIPLRGPDQEMVGSFRIGKEKMLTDASRYNQTRGGPSGRSVKATEQRDELQNPPYGLLLAERPNMAM